MSSKLVRRPHPTYPGAESSKAGAAKHQFFSRKCTQCSNFDPNNYLQRCSGCLKAHYCNKTCQDAHWKRHKPLCQKEEKLQQSALIKELDTFLDAHLLVTLTMATHWAIYFQGCKTSYVGIYLTQRRKTTAQIPPSRYFTLDDVRFVERSYLMLDLFPSVEEHLQKTIEQDTRSDVLPVIIIVNDFPVKCTTISLQHINPKFYEKLRDLQNMQAEGELGWLNRAKLIIEHGLVMRIAGQNRGDSKDQDVVTQQVFRGDRDMIEAGVLEPKKDDKWAWKKVERSALPVITGCPPEITNMLLPDFSPEHDFVKEFGEELSKQGLDPKMVFRTIMQNFVGSKRLS